jgi:hypothetical protein
MLGASTFFGLPTRRVTDVELKLLHGQRESMSIMHRGSVLRSHVIVLIRIRNVLARRAAVRGRSLGDTRRPDRDRERQLVPAEIRIALIEYLLSRGANQCLALPDPTMMANAIGTGWRLRALGGPLPYPEGDVGAKRAKFRLGLAAQGLFPVDEQNTGARLCKGQRHALGDASRARRGRSPPCSRLWTHKLDSQLVSRF